jgi:hypothetical protein
MLNGGASGRITSLVQLKVACVARTIGALLDFAASFWYQREGHELAPGEHDV